MSDFIDVSSFEGDEELVELETEDNGTCQQLNLLLLMVDLSFGFNYQIDESLFKYFIAA